MKIYSELIKVTPQSLELVRDLVLNRTGVYFADDKLDLFLDKIGPLVIERDFYSLLDYYYLLQYDPVEAHQEWQNIANALSVPETYFGREPAALNLLADVLLPQYAAEFADRPLQIWCAACATGEEPLSIAIWLQERGWYDRLDIKIWGTDASSKAVTKAQSGIFRSRSFRSLDPELKAKYFTQVSELEWKIDPIIHQKVRWGIVNIADKIAVAPYAIAPFIFCRNVFIYFSDDNIRMTAEQFYDYMPEPGYLFLGVSESLLRLMTRFKLQDLHNCFVYTKMPRADLGE